MPRTKAVDKTNEKDKPLGWVSSDALTTLWTEVLPELKIDTSAENGEENPRPMHNAWARAITRGFELGPPTSQEIELEEFEGKTSVLKQHFVHATGYSFNDANQTTEFRDARGLIVSESGL